MDPPWPPYPHLPLPYVFGTRGRVSFPDPRTCKWLGLPLFTSDLGYFEGEQPYLADLLTIVINHLLTGMILQVPIKHTLPSSMLSGKKMSKIHSEWVRKKGKHRIGVFPRFPGFQARDWLRISDASPRSFDAFFRERGPGSSYKWAWKNGTPILGGSSQWM